MIRYITIITSALMLLASHVFAGVEGSMDCKVKSNNFIYMVEGKPLEYDGLGNEFRVGDKLKIIYGYGVYRNNQPGVFFYVKDELRNNTHFKLLINDLWPQTFMNFSEDIYIMRADSYLRQDFYLESDLIRIKSKEFVGLSDGEERMIDAKLSLMRYYKNDWQAIISDQNNANGRHVYTLDCRNTNDKLDALKSEFEKYFKEWQKAEDLKTEEAKNAELVQEATQELYLFDLDQLNKQLDEAKKRIAELEATQE